MSGGSLDYAEYRLNEIVESIRARARTPLHRAFATHLEKCAKAAHDLEWMLSGDTSEGSEIEAIKAVLPKKAALKQLVDEANEVMRQLREELERVSLGGE